MMIPILNFRLFIQIPLPFKFLALFILCINLMSCDKSSNDKKEEKEGAVEEIQNGVYLAAVQKDGKWGFIDKSNKVVIPLEYDDVGDFSEGLAVVRKKTEGSGYIDKSNKIIIPLEYDAAESFSEGLAPVVKDGKWKFIDKSNNTIISLEEYDYNRVWPFSEGLAHVRDGNNVLKNGFIDKTGKIVIPLEYYLVSSFSEGLAYVSKKDDIAGFIDKSNKIVIPLEYKNWAGIFSEGLVYICEGNSVSKCGFIDKSNKIIIPYEHNNVSSFSEGLASVCKGDKCGFIDKSNKIIIPLEYDWVGDFSDGLAAASKNGFNGECGFIDKSNKIIIPFKFKKVPDNYDGGPATASCRVGNFHHGLAAVSEKEGKKWGFVNKSNKIIIPFEYDEVWDFVKVD